MMLLCQWHQRLLLSRSFLSRAATLNFYGGQTRPDLYRSISSAVFVFQVPLCQNYHHQECIWGTSPPAIANRAPWIYNMSSRSGRCSRSQRLLGHREGGVSFTQQRFASDDKNYRRSKFMKNESVNNLSVCIVVIVAYINRRALVISCAKATV